MAYATLQDLIERFGEKELLELTDHDNTGAIVPTVAQRALDDAASEINGYLQTLYPLPLPVVPAVLERLACDMARYYLFDDRVTTAVEERYKNAVAFLRGVANGTVSLGIDAGGQAAPETGGPAVVAAPRVFKRDSLSDY